MSIKPNLGLDDSYEIIALDIDDGDAALEALGTKRKFWFTYKKEVYLFKEGRLGTGENWAEVVAADICEFLCIPHAPYYLARVKGKDGVITPNIVPKTSMLVHGNEILAKLENTYDKSLTYRARQHRVGTVLAALQSFAFSSDDEHHRLLNGAEMFVGYLMLDALIGNTDRHHENWAIIVTEEEKQYLAPSYDHASSLGRNESNEKRKLRLTTNDKRQDIQWYASKAPSALYSSTNKLTTFGAFQEAQRKLPRAANYWLERLNRLDTEAINAIVSRIPLSVMSTEALTFAIEMIKFNRDRLLNSGSGDK